MKRSRAGILLFLSLGFCLGGGAWWYRRGLDRSAPDPRAPGIVTVVAVKGTSMEPRFRDGENVAVSLNTAALRREDVVLLKKPGLDHYLIKRIAGVSGDAIALEKVGSKSVVRINSEAVKNSRGTVIDFANHRRALEKLIRFQGGVVPDGFYFVTGDQPSGTSDSSLYGWFSRDEISGRVLEEAPPD